MAAAASFYSLNPGVKKSLYSGAAGQENTAKAAGLRAIPCCRPSSVYTVLYNGNGFTGGSVPVDPSSPYKEGSPVVVLGVGSLSRSGYLFTGWNTAADGSGTSYAVASTFTVIESTVLYAQWTLSYTVTYNGYLSDGGLPPVDPLSPYATGSTVTVLGNTGGLFRYSCEFAGWNTRQDYTGTFYIAGNPFVITSDITLYSEWYAL